MIKPFFVLLVLYLQVFILQAQEQEQVIDHSILNKRINFKKEKAEGIAELILKNNIYAFDLWDVVPYDGEIDWKSNPYNNRSWRLYFHSLRMVGCLARAFEFKKETDYVRKAMEIISSWHINRDNSGWDVWTDHAVANRVLNISHLYFVAFSELEVKDKKLIKDILYEHGHWLYDDANYTKGNHSIMQDRALMQLALTFQYGESDEWYKKGFDRILNTFDEEITNEGVVVENSPAYHPYVMDLLHDFIKMQENFGKSVPLLYYDRYSDVVNYITYMLKPSGTFPTIGDTYYSNSPFRYLNKYNDEELLFVTSDGREGVIPSHVDKFYPNSGYAILRDGWLLNGSLKKDTQLFFTNTNKSVVHKHADNLSFELFSNGEDLIVDPGHMGYEKDSLSNYLKSTIAHNGLSIDNLTYDVKNTIKTEAEILNYKSEKNYSFFHAIFSPDSSVTFNRRVLFIKPNIFVFIDDVNLSRPTDYKLFTQTFNFGKTIKNIKSSSEDKISFEFNNNTLDIYQLNNVNEFVFYNSENDYRGKIAAGPLKYRNGVQVVFKKNILKNSPERNKFVTVFVINNDNSNNLMYTDLKIEVDENKIHITKSGLEISLD